MPKMACRILRAAAMRAWSGIEHRHFDSHRGVQGPGEIEAVQAGGLPTKPGLESRFLATTGSTPGVRWRGGKATVYPSAAFAFQSDHV